MITKYETIFTREGNKKKYLSRLFEFFPPHEVFIEPFLGTGAVFFNKPLAPHNFLNDSSKFIFNFFSCLQNDRERLERRIRELPIYLEILREEGVDIFDETARKVLLLESSYMSVMKTIHFSKYNPKSHLLEKTKKQIFEKIKFAKISNKDFLDFLNSIAWKNLNSKSVFVYCDPPYLSSKSRNIPENFGWSEEKLRTLVEFLLSKRVNFAISEFDDEKTMRIFEEYGLEIHGISESKGFVRTLSKTKKWEILATNFSSQDSLF